MAKKQSTDLKLIDIKKQSEQLHETAQYELEDGHTITFSPLFGDLQIENMLEELQQHYITMKDKGIELSEKMNLYFINLLIIKHFTHFSKDMPSELLAVGKKAGLLDWLNHFADTGLMKTIMDEVFLPDQIMRVYDKLTEFVGTSLLLNELSEKTQRNLDVLRLKHSNAISKLETDTAQ
jgi:hypothetical protein